MDLGNEFIGEVNNSLEVSTVGKLLGFAGNGGEDLHELTIALSVLELVNTAGSLVKALLDEGKGLGVKGGLALLFEERGGGKALEKTTSFGDDGDGFFVLSDFLLELSVLLVSIVIEFIDGL